MSERTNKVKMPSIRTSISAAEAAAEVSSKEVDIYRDTPLRHVY